MVTQTHNPATAADLLDILGENIMRLRAGEATPAIANAIVNSSAAMLRIVKLQMDYAKMTGQTPEIPMLLTEMEDSMTTIAQALRTVSLGLAELAEALEGSDLPPLRAIDEPVAGVPSPTPVPADPNREAILGTCPVHFTAWTLKEGGISKAGKAYSAFWKCDQKNADGTWCQKKPTLEWVRTHDPAAVPF